MGSVSPELAAKYKAAAQRSRSAIKGKQVQIRGPEPETDLATTGVRAGMAVMAPKLAVATAIAKNQPIRNAAAALVTGGIMGAKKARGKGPLFDILARNYTTQGKKQWDVTKDKSWSQDAEEYLKEEPTAYNKTAPGNMVLIQQDTDPVTKAKADKIMELSGAPETERKYVESALFDAVPDSEIYKALKQKYKTVSFPEDDEPAE
jgi:hypothetical protein